MIIVDESLEDCKLDELLTVLRLRADEAPVIVLTADHSTKRKLNLIKLGAMDVVVKNEETNDLLDHVIDTQLMRIQMQAQIKELKKSLEGISISSSPQLYGISLSGDTEQTLETYTMGIIRHYLGKYNNNVVVVARKLDVGKSTIYRYLKENKLTLAGALSVDQQSSIANLINQELNFSVSGNPAIYSNPMEVQYGYTNVPIDPSMIADDDVRAAFTYLKGLSKGNPAFIINMTANFIDAMKALISQMANNSTMDNRLSLQNKLTKIKSSAVSMGMKSLAERITQLQEVLQQRNDENVVVNAMQELSSRFLAIEKVLAAERMKLISAMGKITTGS
jgi:DNA-binding NarL/FixJ family response regulator/HPt (histidine-containing phosphotransfer) domain-containing protein